VGKLDGRVAVITGAASGNGRGIALRFADEGADLVLADLDEERLQESAKLVAARGRRVLARRCDVASVSDLEALYAAAADTFGQLHVAVANAGVVERETDCFEISAAQWDRTIGVNLKGAFFTLQGAARCMRAQGGGGRLVAIGSIMGLWGAAGTPAYCASKGGVQQIVKCFALAGAPHGITCNGIGPGFITTAMTSFISENPLFEGFLVDRTPAGRIGSAEDVAGVAAFLASDDARFLNGSMVYADGGITAGLYSAAASRLEGVGTQG
jgi:NAD(P)-dependent dehydrogenase (short-subunit alcohol dehydrogenase family)